MSSQFAVGVITQSQNSEDGKEVEDVKEVGELTVGWALLPDCIAGCGSRDGPECPSYSKGAKGAGLRGHHRDSAWCVLEVRAGRRGSATLGVRSADFTWNVKATIESVKGAKICKRVKMAKTAKMSKVSKMSGS